MLIDGLTQKKGSVKMVIRGLELILLIAGFISTILMFKGAFESTSSYDINILSTLIRQPWFYFKSWLSSSFYICIIINLIVILILASSFSHHHRMDNNNNGDDFVSVGDVFECSLPQPPPPAAPPPRVENGQQNQEFMTRSLGDQQSNPDNLRQQEPRKEQKCPTHTSRDQEYSNSDNLIKHRQQESRKEQEYLTRILTDQASSPDHVTKRKQAPRKKHEFRNLGEPRKKEEQESENVEEEKEDTMEATWRAITGEGENPRKKQLKKSDTWPKQPIISPSEPDDEEKIELEEKQKKCEVKELKKCMTFNDSVSIRCRGGLIRRDPSISLEEFNGKVEAFIKNFNNDMRLQRQESDQRYLEMINRSL